MSSSGPPPDRAPRSRERSGRLLARAAFALVLLVHLVVLYAPSVPGPEPAVPNADKAVHVLVFAVVMLAGAVAGIRPVILAAALAIHAPVSELIQHLALPGRSGDAGDVAANLAGVALGWYLAGVLRRRHRIGVTGG